MITIHSYRVWDNKRGEYVIPLRKSTVAHIDQIGGEVIPGTAEDVEVEEVSAEGRHDTAETIERAVHPALSGQRTAPGRKPLFRS